MPKVYNKRNRDAPLDAVYVGRPSKFGNPFLIGRDGDREEVVYKYRKFMENNPELCEDAKQELAGKDLICWCAPALCHADILLDIANEDKS